eukprot:CAMPEP_0174956948 /NCGR_PEP_ID=MMETSP0004_2-20121128/1809_1 /TAXON_ID=420556 /ORGANISM="Ochromonas sp., Strain CCMP1393" /LENGTH=123 /DNA_ID=CAMNT_0016205021 /DNA_START=104 /DNA_END=475 /DNA_ORIENTATION=+
MSSPSEDSSLTNSLDRAHLGSVSSLDSIVAGVDATRRARAEIKKKLEDLGWERIDKSNNNFEHPRCPLEMRSLLFKLRAPILPMEIFNRIVTDELLEDVWRGALAADPNVWVYKSTPKMKTIE